MSRKKYSPNLKKNADIKQLIISVSILFTTIAGAPVRAQHHVEFEVTGVIKAHCAFEDTQGITAASSNDVSFSVGSGPLIGVAHSEKVRLALTCNAPFALTLSSQNGGLLNSNSDIQRIGGDFTKQIFYSASVSMTTQDASAPLTVSCQSQDMAAGAKACGATSGSNVAIGEGAGVGEVAVTLVADAKSPVQGRYQDTIFLALSLQ
jgi:spore coat protein U-like protein